MDGLASFTLVVLKAVCDLVAPGNHRKVAKRVVRALGLYIGIMACANRPARAKLVLQLRKVDSAANESEVLSIRKRGRGGEGGEKKKKRGLIFSVLLICPAGFGACVVAIYESPTCSPW